MVQFIKTKVLINKIRTFEDENLKVMKKIQLFLNNINFFFKDSAKKVHFTEDTSEIVFDILDKKGVELKRNNDIEHLSSGEKQLLIIMSYIAFNATDGKIFIIDEPELSLHIKWQEEFLQKLMSIKPTSTQLILATHSPILVNKKKLFVKAVLPYND